MTIDVIDPKAPVCNPENNPVMQKLNLKHLNHLSALLFESREQIVDKWIAREATQKMLAKLQIKPDHFKTTYGIPVVEYFVGVVEGTKELGDCPIMQKFIAFLSERDVTARDIFIVCMALRRSLIGHVFTFEKAPLEEVPDLLEEISDIFDGNLSGVLQTFSDLTREKDKKLHEQLLINKQQKQIQTILNLQNSIVGLVKNNKIVLANKKFFETVGVKNLKIFHEHYPYEWGFITDVDYHPELFKSKDYIAWFEKILNDVNHPPVKVTITNHKTQKNVIFILKASKLPEQQNQYIITMADVTLYEQQMQELTSLAYTDQITGLYNKLKFEITLKEFAKKEDAILILLDIDRFERLQKDYDEALVDQLLNQIAQFLQFEVERSFSIFRVDNSTFALMSDSYEMDVIETCVQTIQTKISKLQFYIAEEITCSFGTISIREQDDYESLEERLYHVIEELKFSKARSIKTDDEFFEKQASLAQENKDIMDILRAGAIDDRIWEMTVTYKEIPVNWELQYVQTKSENVVFDITNDTSLLFKAKKVYFKLPEQDKIVEASLGLINTKQKRVQLNTFRFIENNPLNRKSVSVKPQKDFTVLVHDEVHAITGTLQSLSQQVAIINVPSVEGFHVGGNAMVDIILSNNNKTVKILTEVNLYMFQKMDQGYNITLTLLLDQDNEQKLKNYIAWRQLQIIKELKNLINNTP
ncbi:MAG: GGDEF domain-containing protein [Epsilonproteobacteria bacterium]|nr:GGDEF domain-containing protein [Campylobacterota bacterium]